MTARRYQRAIDTRGEERTARYRTLCPAAVAALVLAALAALSIFSWMFQALSLGAIAAGWWALRRIRYAPEELTGAEVAWTGMGLAVVFALIGCGVKLWGEGSGPPYGYQVIAYEDLQPDAKNPEEKVPPAAVDLNEKQVFVKGYMAPTRQQIRLKRFILCPTIGDCKFCNAGLARTKMIRVELTSDLVTDYTTRLVGVGGIFKVDANNPTGVPYSINVNVLR